MRRPLIIPRSRRLTGLLVLLGLSTGFLVKTILDEADLEVRRLPGLIGCTHAERGTITYQGEVRVHQRAWGPSPAPEAWITRQGEALYFAFHTAWSDFENRYFIEAGPRSQRVLASAKKPYGEDFSVRPMPGAQLDAYSAALAGLGRIRPQDAAYVVDFESSVPVTFCGSAHPREIEIELAYDPMMGGLQRAKPLPGASPFGYFKAAYRERPTEFQDLSRPGPWSAGPVHMTLVYGQVKREKGPERDFSRQVGVFLRTRNARAIIEKKPRMDDGLIGFWDFVARLPDLVDDLDYVFQERTLVATGKLHGSGRPVRLSLFFGDTDLWPRKPRAFYRELLAQLTRDPFYFYIGQPRQTKNFNLRSLTELAEVDFTEFQGDLRRHPHPFYMAGGGYHFHYFETEIQRARPSGPVDVVASLTPVYRAEFPWYFLRFLDTGTFTYPRDWELRNLLSWKRFAGPVPTPR